MPDLTETPADAGTSGTIVSAGASVILKSHVSETANRKSRRSFWMVLICTFFLAGAQVLIKTGAGALGENATLVETAIGILTTPSLFAGYSMYGLFTAVMVVALRDGELSMLYPVIALGYVWVSILSVWIFNEQMTPLKAAGVVVIVAGVAVLGKGQSPAKPGEKVAQP